MKPEATKISVEIAGGKQLSIETGKLAKQAGGSAVVRFGENLVLSAATENDPDVCGINAASAALTLSDIPFLGPIAAVRVGLVEGRFIANPTYTEMRDGLLNIMVVGTADAIVMIESGAKEVKEETVVDAIEFAHTEIKKICAAINELRSKVGKPKRKVTPPELDETFFKRLESQIGKRLAESLDTARHTK